MSESAPSTVQRLIYKAYLHGGLHGFIEAVEQTHVQLCTNDDFYFIINAACDNYDINLASLAMSVHLTTEELEVRIRNKKPISGTMRLAFKMYIVNRCRSSAEFFERLLALPES